MMLHKILSALWEGTLFWRVRKYLRKRLCRAARAFIKKHYAWLPIVKNRIVFDNFGGRGFADHPRYIAEEIHRRGLDWDMVWLVSDLNTPVPDWIRKVKYGSLRSLYDCATAKMWVDNIRNAHLLPKRRQQIYLQTWHGSQMFVFKRIEKDAEDYLSPRYLALARQDGAMCDGILSQSARDSEVFRTSFWLSDRCEILEFGGPREDVLFDAEYLHTHANGVRKSLGISGDDYVVLYAPTFRDNGDTSAYRLDFDAIRDAFAKKTGRRCRLILRLHPNVNRDSLAISFDDSLLDGNAVADINDLLIISDFVISDFSSLIYEASLLKKPVFLCALDYDEYVKQRPLVPAMNSYPFLSFRNCQDLVEAVVSTDFNTYWLSIAEYLTTHPSFDNGQASQRAVDWLIAKATQ